MKVTIKDIAREANVSTSTVSLVLNNKPCRVSDKTRKLIFDIAKKNQYRVNLAARSLVTRERKVIGLIVPDIENLFFSSLSKKIEEYCLGKGYLLIIVNSNDKENNDVKLLDMLVSFGVDGVLLTPSNESLLNGVKLKNYLKKMSIPFVLIDRYFEDLKTNRVYFDNEDGADQAISILVEKGHKKIGCISGGKRSKNGYSRVIGYKKALIKNNLPFSEEYIYDGNYRFDGGYEAGNSILKTDLTAVFICNDMMTLGFIRSMQEHGKKIPRDISIVSYDNTINYFLPWIEICSVEQNTEELAISSCQCLFSILEGKNNKLHAIRLRPKLIVKNSIKSFL